MRNALLLALAAAAAMAAGYDMDMNWLAPYRRAGLADRPARLPQ